MTGVTTGFYHMAQVDFGEIAFSISANTHRVGITRVKRLITPVGVTVSPIHLAGEIVNPMGLDMIMLARASASQPYWKGHWFVSVDHGIYLVVIAMEMCQIW